MAVRFARVAAVAAVLVGVIAIPVLATMPSPLQLCSLRPPFDCITAQMTGSQYIEGDSPAALGWLITSLVIGPFISLAGVWLFQRGRVGPGRAVAAFALLPHVMLIAVPHLALVPFHPLVFALTLAALLALLAGSSVANAADQIGAPVTTGQGLAALAVVLLILVAGIALLYAARSQVPPTTVPPAATTMRLGSEASACGRLTDYAVSPTPLNPTERVLTLELRSVNQTTNSFRYRLAGSGTTPSDLGTQFTAGTPQVLFIRGWFAPPNPAIPREVTVMDYSVTRMTEPCPVSQ